LTISLRIGGEFQRVAYRPNAILQVSRMDARSSTHVLNSYGLVTVATGSYGETGVMDFGLYAASPTHCITTSRRRLDAKSVG